ncbi:MAG TPA: hypothetical protein VG406_13765 [Isosphaeraceae bacterium]|jgi:hypothetical protein|nr:hypothetical protein [Isosphaeraceae bacterium]
MPLNWNTRLAVAVNGTIISPIESFSPTLNVGHRVQHSLEADNVGVVTQAQTFTFSLTVRAMGAAVALLTQLALAGTAFQIVITEQTGSDWTFNQVAFNNCFFTSAAPSNVTLDDAPTATFSGLCLDVEPS